MARALDSCPDDCFRQPRTGAALNAQLAAYLRHCGDKERARDLGTAADAIVAAAARDAAFPGVTSAAIALSLPGVSRAASHRVREFLRQLVRRAPGTDLSLLGPPAGSLPRTPQPRSAKRRRGHAGAEGAAFDDECLAVAMAAERAAARPSSSSGRSFSSPGQSDLAKRSRLSLPASAGGPALSQPTASLSDVTSPGCGLARGRRLPVAPAVAGPSASPPRAPPAPTAASQSAPSTSEPVAAAAAPAAGSGRAGSAALPDASCRAPSLTPASQSSVGSACRARSRKPFPAAPPAGSERSSSSWVPPLGLRAARVTTAFETCLAAVLARATEASGVRHRLDFRSGAYAILLALHRCHIGWGEGDFPAEPEQWVRKERLIALATPFSRSSFAEAKGSRGSGARYSYTAFASAASLEAKGLVLRRGRPALFSLAPAGSAFAAVLHANHGEVAAAGADFEASSADLFSQCGGDSALVNKCRSAARRGALHAGLPEDVEAIGAAAASKPGGAASLGAEAARVSQRSRSPPRAQGSTCGAVAGAAGGTGRALGDGGTKALRRRNACGRDSESASDSDSDSDSNSESGDRCEAASLTGSPLELATDSDSDAAGTCRDPPLLLTASHEAPAEGAASAEMAGAADAGTAQPGRAASGQATAPPRCRPQRARRRSGGVSAALRGLDAQLMGLDPGALPVPAPKAGADVLVMLSDSDANPDSCEDEIDATGDGGDGCREAVPGGASRGTLHGCAASRGSNTAEPAPPSQSAAWRGPVSMTAVRVAEETADAAAGALPGPGSRTKRRESQLGAGARRPAGGPCFCAPLGNEAPSACEWLPKALRGERAVAAAHSAAVAASMNRDRLQALARAFGADHSRASVVAIVATNEPHTTSDALAAAGVSVRREVLPAADIAFGIELSSPETGGPGGAVLFMSGFAIERKTVSDLLGSIRSNAGRQLLQRWFMARCGLRRLSYLIEGGSSCSGTYGDVEVNRKALATSRRGAMAAGFSVLTTESLKETAAVVAAHGSRLQALVLAGWAEWLHPCRTLSAWQAAMKALRAEEQVLGHLTVGAMQQVPTLRGDAPSTIVAATGGSFAGCLDAASRGRQHLRATLREHATEAGIPTTMSTGLPRGMSATALGAVVRALGGASVQ